MCTRIPRLVGSANSRCLPSMGRSIKIIWQLELFFQPHRKIDKGWTKSIYAACHCNVFAKSQKTLENLKLFCFCLDGGLLFSDLRFSRGNLEPNPLEKRGMSVADCLFRWLVGWLDGGGILRIKQPDRCIKYPKFILT